MSDFVFEERPYQREAVEKALALFDAGSESVLIESPVGSGKTVMGLMIVQELQRRMPLKVNYVASRKHILDQMSKLNAEFFHCDLTPVSVFSPTASATLALPKSKAAAYLLITACK